MVRNHASCQRPARTRRHVSATGETDRPAPVQPSDERFRANTMTVTGTRSLRPSLKHRSAPEPPARAVAQRCTLLSWGTCHAQRGARTPSPEPACRCSALTPQSAERSKGMCDGCHLHTKPVERAHCMKQGHLRWQKSPTTYDAEWAGGGTRLSPHRQAAP